MRRFEHLDVPYQWAEYWTKYPHGYTIFEALCSWTKQVDNMVDNQNNWNDYLDDFVEVFDENLQGKVIKTLSEWQDSGMLDVIIDDALQTQIDVLEDETNGKFGVIEPQLEHNTYNLNSTFINAKYPPPPMVGAKGNGIDDDTAALQSLLDVFDRIMIPEGTYLINTATENSGLQIRSNQEIICSKRTWLKATEKNTTTYRIVNISNVENVTITNLQILGDRDYNSNTVGEHGHGIAIVSSKNIVLNNPITKKCFGDGLYIGSDGVTPENIKIFNHVSDSNRRQGMSIVAGSGLTFDGCVYKNTHGTSPAAGVDIEPNDALGELENIKFVNPTTNNNENVGILISLRKFANSNKNISITIESHEDNGSVGGFAVVDCGGGFYGDINNISPVYKNSVKSAIYVRDYDVSGARINIEKPIIIDCNTRNDSSSKYGAAISIFKEPSDVRSVNTGNVHIIEPTVIDTRTPKQIPLGIYACDESDAKPLLNMSIINPIRLDSTKESPIIFKGSQSRIEDKNKICRYTGDEDITFGMWSHFTEFSNENFTQPRTITLANYVFDDFPELTFTMDSDIEMIISPLGQPIMPLSNVVGQKIHSTKKGSTITIKRNVSGTWFVTKMVGEWDVI